jgi:hypothetical protein
MVNGNSGFIDVEKAAMARGRSEVGELQITSAGA